MLTLGFTFVDKEQIVLDLPDGRKVILRHFKKNEAKHISIDAPKDVIIYREKIVSSRPAWCVQKMRLLLPESHRRWAGIFKNLLDREKSMEE